MSEVIVISPDKLHEIVKDAVASGVGAAIAAISQNTPKEMNDFEAAEYLGISSQTLRCWRVEKKGPPYHKNGRSVRYAKKDLDVWLAGNRVLTIDSPEVYRGKFC